MFTVATVETAVRWSSDVRILITTNRSRTQYDGFFDSNCVSLNERHLRSGCSSGLPMTRKNGTPPSSPMIEENAFYGPLIKMTVPYCPRRGCSVIDRDKERYRSLVIKEVWGLG